MSDPQLRLIAQRSGLSPRELARYVDADLITLPLDERSEVTMSRVRLVRRLRRDLGIELEVVAIIVRLLDRIEALEAMQRPDSAGSVQNEGEGEREIHQT